jgi:hypothetical protein
LIYLSFKTTIAKALIIVFDPEDLAGRDPYLVIER